ncbi:MAG: ABC transporter permease, partial [Candidatus Lokiarchaeota archaeon]|nr:ABC transporter permease [Candidatus Lokiarchaeota archaeon]
MKAVKIKSLTLNIFKNNPVFIILIAVIFISYLFVPKFLSIRNIDSFFNQIPALGLIVIGEFLVILTGGIDLSVGSVMAFSACLMCGLIVFNGISIIVAISIALLSGAIAGLISGIAVGYLKIAPFVATLGVMSIFRGLTLIYTGKAAISGLPPFFLNVLNSNIFGLPMLTFLFIIVIVIIHFMVNNTKLGMHMYAIGGNEEAAYIAGVSVAQVKIITYIISGTLSALSGVFMATRLISAQPLMGIEWELRAITGVIVGGASIFGGIGTVINTIFGLLIAEIVSND